MKNYAKTDSNNITIIFFNNSATSVPLWVYGAARAPPFIVTVRRKPPGGRLDLKARRNGHSNCNHFSECGRATPLPHYYNAKSHIAFRSVSAGALHSESQYVISLSIESGMCRSARSGVSPYLLCRPLLARFTLRFSSAPPFMPPVRAACYFTPFGFLYAD